MPELPEVETVARQLAPRLVGRTVAGLRIYDPRLRSGRTPALAGRKVIESSRVGKRVLIGFSGRRSGGSPLWLGIHLRMTGRLIVVAPGVPVERAHLRASFRLDHGSLLFHDTRRFGTFDWYRSRDEATSAGLDPLDRGLTPRRLARLLDGSRQAIKVWLLRQDRLVGLGNIYASEILHAASISPFREAGSLEGGEIARLRSETRRILRRAIRNCGTTFSDFQDARGEIGSYQQYLAVYEREGEPCRRCGGPIERLVQHQRSTYFCRDCQR